MPKDNQIPAKYLCSITGQVMIDPVMAADGYTYEREAIEQWLQSHDTSPRTNEKLDHKKLTANHDKRSDTLEFLDSHPEFYIGDEVYLPKAWAAECVMAIKNNQLQVVQRWLDKDKRLLTSKLEDESTALHLACEFSSPELVDSLLKILKQRNQSVQPGAVGFKSTHLNVLLERALNSGDHSKCELLLRLGAEVEQPEPSTQNTLLQRMVIKGKEKAVSWLLEQKAVLESRNREGNTPLLLSVIHGQTNLTAFLLKVQANPQLKNAQDETPFYIAVEKGDVETARLLVAQGANPSVSCGTGQLNPLHIAAERGDVAMLKYLLQTRASTLIDVQNANGDTPLHLAVKAGQDNVISLLLVAGAYHKIKNEQDQTPVELARAQQRPRTANFIVQTVRGLKKAKLEETARLHQVVAEQAAEIANLKTALQSQGQLNEKLIADMEGMQLQIKRLQPASQPLTPSSPALIFRPASPSISFHIPAVAPNANPKEVEEFLRLVAEGEQDKAEAMLKSNPALALVPGDVTDLSKRTFNGITAFQYAVWALDWHMWKMIRKYLPDEATKEQVKGFETGSWVRQHGISAQHLLDNLVKALQLTSGLYEERKYDEGNTAWVKQVGGAQRLLPAHVVHEYCHPTRPFYPLPNFNDALALPRSRTFKTGEWFTATIGDGNLGKTFACYRASDSGVTGLWHLAARGQPWGTAKNRSSTDLDSVLALMHTRTTQREELIAELSLRRLKT